MFVKTSLGNVFCSIEGKGLPVLLIHGFGSSHRQWMYTAPALTQAGYQSISIDLPGFGDSELPAHSISTDKYADALAEVLEQLKIQQAILVGSSMGAQVAWIFAGLFPHMVRGLVLANSAGAPLQSSLPSRRKHPPAWRAGFLSLPGFAAVAKYQVANPLTRRLVRPIIHNSFGDLSRLTPKVFETLHQAAKQAQIALKGGLSKAEVDSDKLLANIKCPTLIAWGDKDKIVPMSCMDYFIDRVPHAKLKVYFSVGHLPMLEVPEDFNSDVLAFIHHVVGQSNQDLLSAQA